MTQTDKFPKAIAFAWAIAFARWPIFQMVSFLECLVFFGAVFCTEQLQCSCRIVFRLFLAFLIVDPKWQFCKGYSLCMGYRLWKIADFQNGLNSRIFGVFWSGFLHRTIPILLYNGFSHVLGIFNFWPKLTILQTL